jgi:DNA-binding CsgD family transcriptional regulator
VLVKTRPFDELVPTVLTAFAGAVLEPETDDRRGLARRWGPLTAVERDVVLELARGTAADAASQAEIRTKVLARLEVTSEPEAAAIARRFL